MSTWKSKLDAMQHIQPLFQKKCMAIDELQTDIEKIQSKKTIFSYMKSKIQPKQKFNTKIESKSTCIEAETPI